MCVFSRISTVLHKSDTKERPCPAFTRVLTDLSKQFTFKTLEGSTRALLFLLDLAPQSNNYFLLGIYWSEQLV